MIFKINDYPKNTVMHCKTEEEAEIFTEYLEKLGFTWSTGRDYSMHGTRFEVEGDQTCYNYNTGNFSNLEWYLIRGYKVLEFDDFEWDGYSKSDNTISVDNTDSSAFEKFLNMFRKGSENK